jgi:8-amino-7-oxononanoate synthase
MRAFRWRIGGEPSHARGAAGDPAEQAQDSIDKVCEIRLVFAPESPASGLTRPRRVAASAGVATRDGHRARTEEHVMGLRSRLVERGKQIATSPRVLRIISDDRFRLAAEGLMDAPNRARAVAQKAGEAWEILLKGHALPSIDPSIDDDPVPAPAARHRAAARPRKPGARDESADRTNGRAAASADDGDDLAAAMASRTSLAALGGRDVFEKAYKFKAADNARKMGVYPYFRPLDFNDGPEAVLEGRRVTMFGSNNYLGLTTHPKVREAATEAIKKFGTSMTGSRLVNGSMKLHNQLEEKLAAFFGKESALVFTTGYQVNIATISALVSNKKCVAVIDRNDHASIYDGVRLGQAVGARMVRYKHNDAEDLDRILSDLGPEEGAFVITDGVFSAEGEIAHLPEILAVTQKHKVRLFVDDAHALGVIGPQGRGTAAHFGILDQIDLVGGTFSKSLASIGGWLVGERKVLDYIQHFASSFLFAASAAPPSVAAAMAALEVMQEEPWRIDKLRENHTYMRGELKKMGFDVGKSETAVIPVYVRQDLRTIMMWKELLDVHGIYTNPFISPGVPPKQAMLRTSYMATHTREHLDRGLEAFRATGKKFGLI